MLPLSRPRPTAAARLAAAFVALTAVGCVTAAAAPAPTSPGTSAAAVTTAVAPCVSTGSHDRVRAGSVGKVTDPNDVSAAQTRQMDSALRSRLANRQRSLARSGESIAQSRQIDVYVHVIEKSSGKGGVSTSRIKKQISVLNSAYAGSTSKYSTNTGFTFKLKKIDKTKKSSWYSWSNPEEDPSDDVNAKTKLHKGGADDLNLYLTGLEYPLLGYATFPDEDASAPLLDGVVVLSSSLPGGSAKPYNLGDTATHEIGHWLGLLHTFENDCQAPGDGVADTPAQDYETSDFSVCDANADTCADDPGNDPVHNFMNYADDACLNRFTPGQASRMLDSWNAYRAPVSQA